MKAVKMILTNGFDPDIRVYKEAKYLAERGIDIEIICWDREGKYLDRREDLVDNIKIKRFYIPAQFGTGFKQIKSFLHFIIQCKKYLKGQVIDYLHCHDLDGMIVGYIVRQKNVKLVFDMHEFYESGRMSKVKTLVRGLVNFLQSKSYRIIHVNKQQTLSVKKADLYKLVHLPNYPEPNKFKACIYKESPMLRITYTGYIRHLIPLENLIKAGSHFDNVFISINGQGRCYKILKELETQYKNTCVTGAYNHEDIAKFYSVSDLAYIVYNKNVKNDETALPTKLYEAILTCTPMIVAEGTLMGEFVLEHDIGFVIDGTNEESIKTLIKKIVNDQNILHHKRKNIVKIQYDYTWDKVVKSLDGIYCKD